MVVLKQRSLLVLGGSLCFAASSLAQGTPSDRLNGKSLEAAVSFAQSLAQWEFVIIGGSLLIVIGTSYHRPKRWYIRVFYPLLFLPAWACLARSIYFGTRAQEAFLAYLLLSTSTADTATHTLNADIGNEIYWMWFGLLFLFAWLVGYLAWWTWNNDIEPARSGS